MGGNHGRASLRTGSIGSCSVCLQYGEAAPCGEKGGGRERRAASQYQSDQRPDPEGTPDKSEIRPEPTSDPETRDGASTPKDHALAGAVSMASVAAIASAAVRAVKDLVIRKAPRFECNEYALPRSRTRWRETRPSLPRHNSETGAARLTPPSRKVRVPARSNPEPDDRSFPWPNACTLYSAAS